ncbi:tetratricopeptide repeat protein [Streptomyces sp. NPDC093071]|uniref:tetratricopeptide repeat protein n=1 Tax=Streptomyces sp. NPDC093071 TaxID=3366022 RepID=UPI0038276A64
MIDGKLASLPFHELTSWSRFEQLVCESVQTAERLSPCHRYGSPGQAQAGIDIAGLSEDGQWHAFQVKHVARFTRADAKKALDLFLDGPRPYAASRLVIVTSCTSTRTQVRDLVHHYQTRNPDLVLELWDAEHLASRLRLQPRVVARYFGDHVARRFCDADALEAFHRAGGGDEVGCPVHDADPVDLEVHEAISVDGETAPDEPFLPAYFRRPFDDELDAAVDRALAGTSEMKVLLADSSTGKTRAAWEAVQRLGKEWRLWHPADREDLLASLGAVKPHTVVWLNEINRYLLCGDSPQDEHVAARLTELLRDPRRAPVLVLGTAWHVHWAAMTLFSRGERAKTHALLTTCALPVPERFSDDEVAALLGEGRPADRRMLKAAREAEGGHIIQFLAGGPAQLERYANGSPTARAVLHAAMDARRLGHGMDLPHSFLRAAAAGYLTALQRDLAEPDWFSSALRYLSAPCRGVRGPLAPVPGFRATGSENPSSYRLADYLELYGHRHRKLICPEEEFWDAAAEHAAGARDRVSLSLSALTRGRVNQAEKLAWAAAQDGEGAALSHLAGWIKENRKDEDPYLYYELAAELGDISAQIVIAFRAENDGQIEKAEHWYRKAVDQDSRRWDAVVGLASVSSRRGDGKRAIELYRQALGAGFFGARAVEYQARWLAGRGQHALALLLTKLSFGSGNTEAFTGLAWTYMYKDTPRAIEVLKYAMAEGDVNAPRELTWALEEEGDSDEADRFCEIAVRLGETNALRGLGMIRRRKGDHRAAAALFWRAYNLDLTYVLLDLARLREEEGHLKQAERLYRRALEEGQSSAAGNLVRILETTGRTRQAERLAGRSNELLGSLAKARAARGAYEAAEKLLLAAVARGNPDLLVPLSHIRKQRGDLAGAEKMLRQAQDAGVLYAARWLAKLQDDGQE